MSLLGRLEPKPEGLRLQGLGHLPSNGDAVGNGHTSHTPEGSASGAQELEAPSDDDESTTPRVDKGKGRAEPEPEPVESVLSPTFLTTESDEYPSGNSGDGPIRASPPRHCGSDVRNVVLCSRGPQTVCAPYTKVPPNTTL